MEIRNLYKYNNIVSPIKPEGDYEIRYRIIADKGKVVSRDSLKFYSSIDTDSAEGWLEYDNPEANYEDYLEALAKLGVK